MKTLEKVFEKQGRTPAGAVAQIVVYVQPEAIGGPALRCEIDGTPILATTIDPIPAAKQNPPRTDREGRPITHHMGGKVGFVAEEAATIGEALARAVAAWEATPERQIARLIGERHTLFLIHEGLLDQEQERRERAWDDGDEEGAFRTSRGVEARIAAAARALGDFDAAHPEVLAELARRRQQKLDSFLAAD